MRALERYTMMSKGNKSKSYMKGGTSHGMHSSHNGGQTASSMGKGMKSPHTSRENAAPVKSSGGHKGGSGY